MRERGDSNGDGGRRVFFCFCFLSLYTCLCTTTIIAFSLLTALFCTISLHVRSRIVFMTFCCCGGDSSL